MRRALIVGIVLLFTQVVESQIYQPIEKYTQSDGLSHSWITCLYQDKNEFLWIGTLNGLNRFDGKTFVKYGANFNDSTSLANHQIQKISEDQQGNLWIASSIGISKLLRSTDNFQTYYPYTDSVHKTLLLNIRDITIDKERNQMYILTNESLLNMDLLSGTIKRIQSVSDILSKGRKEFKKLIYNGNDDAVYLYSDASIFKLGITTGTQEYIDTTMSDTFIRDGGIKGIYCGIGGECWIYTNSHLWQLDNLYNLKEIKLLAVISKNSKILALFQRQPEELCIITSGAVVKYDLQSMLAKIFMQFDLHSSDNLVITACYYMDQGIFWFGSREGLFKINHYRQAFTIKKLDDFERIKKEPAFIAYDGKGMLWIASSDGKIVVLDPDLKAGPKAIKSSIDLKTTLSGLKNGPSGNILVGTSKGLYELQNNNGNIKSRVLSDDIPINAFCSNHSDSIWFISNKHLFTTIPGNKINPDFIDLSNQMESDAIDLEKTGNSLYILERFQTIKYNLHESSTNILTLNQLDFKILPENSCFQPLDSKEFIVGTTHGSFIFYLYDFKVLPNYVNSEQLIYPVHAMIQDEKQKVWISAHNGLFSFDRISDNVKYYDISDGLPWQLYSDRLAAKGPAGQICFAGPNNLVIINPDSLLHADKEMKIMLIKAILMSRKGQKAQNLIGVDTLVINTEYNQFLFQYTALDFWDPVKNRYKYSLQRTGLSEEWIDLSNRNSFYISGLKPGDYTLKLKGTNHDMEWSDYIEDLHIKIIAPIWRSRFAFICYAAIILALFYLTILFTTRQLRNINRQYKERELIAKKVELQKEELTQKNKNITDSINYAKRIQMALMPSTKLFKKFFSDSFILHIPKDIVSGDFYWVNEVDGRIYFAAVDCTGHGVPGAFMSIIGFELFRRITEIEKKKQPAEILNSLSHGFETIFRDIEDITLRDGMDAAFCAIDPELKVLEFSGAFNPLYLVRDNTITEIKGDRFAVGLSHAEDDLPPQQFKDHVIPLMEDDVIYIFTDGYADQFGGPEGKKYKYRRFRHLLLALHQLPMERQVEFLKRSIMDWKGNLDQVDDVLVMGIRIHQQNKEKNS